MSEQAKIRRMIIETPKDESAFIYTVFESNEGLCFYSTIGEILGHPDRKLLLHSPVSLSQEFDQMMSYLIKKVPSLKILEDTIVVDNFDLENTSLKRKSSDNKINEQK